MKKTNKAKQNKQTKKKTKENKQTNKKQQTNKCLIILRDGYFALSKYTPSSSLHRHCCWNYS